MQSELLRCVITWKDVLDHTPKNNFDIEKEILCSLKGGCSVALCSANSLFVLFKLSLALTRMPRLTTLHPELRIYKVVNILHIFIAIRKLAARHFCKATSRAMPLSIPLRQVRSGICRGRTTKTCIYLLRVRSDSCHRLGPDESSSQHWNWKIGI